VKTGRYSSCTAAHEAPLQPKEDTMPRSIKPRPGSAKLAPVVGTLFVCSCCAAAKPLPDHYLCRRCRDYAPADTVYVSDLVRGDFELMVDYVARMRRDARRGQIALNAKHARGQA
jgi:hypothetical protein